MGAKSRFYSASSVIAEYLDSQDNPVFSQRQLEDIFRRQRSQWKLAKSMSASQFLAELVRYTVLTAVRLDLPSGERALYCRQNATPYQVVLALGSHTYLSHHSALYLHGLLPAAPQQLYCNQEQSAKQPPAAGELTQAAVDAAFARPPRLSQDRAVYQNYELVLLRGQATGQLGVVRLHHPEAGEVAVTSLLRTLLDVTVRPAYAGGVAQVVAAYREAAPYVSVQLLQQLLQQLSYRYPYQQAVGFYLERAGGYQPEDIHRFRQLPQTLDFYLAHGMRDIAYSPEWRLYYPADLE